MVLLGLTVAVLLGTAWSMPLEMDQAMQDLAQADIEVKKFYAAWERKDFPHMLELYHKLDEALPKLKADLNKLQKIDFSDNNAQFLKRLLSIQFESAIMKLHGMLPPRKVSIEQSLEQQPRSSKSLVHSGTLRGNVGKQMKPTQSPDAIRNKKSSGPARTESPKNHVDKLTKPMLNTGNVRNKVTSGSGHTEISKQPAAKQMKPMLSPGVIRHKKSSGPLWTESPMKQAAKLIKPKLNPAIVRKKVNFGSVRMAIPKKNGAKLMKPKLNPGVVRVGNKAIPLN